MRGNAATMLMAMVGMHIGNVQSGQNCQWRTNSWAHQGSAVCCSNGCSNACTAAGCSKSNRYCDDSYMSLTSSWDYRRCSTRRDYCLISRDRGSGYASPSSSNRYCAGTGVCTSDWYHSSWSCECDDGYSGKICDVDACSESKNPCSGHGRCIREPFGRKSCSCDASTGYTGAACDQKIDYCSTEKAKRFDCSEGRKHGACVSDWRNKAFSCSCSRGWTSTHCDVKVDFCADKTCSGHGVCTSHFDALDYTCACTDGYSGKDCNIDACNPSKSPCTGRGDCTRKPNGGKSCSCDLATGFTGAACTQKIDYCTGKCSGNGQCRANWPTQTYTCDCSPGWTGVDCDLERDYCLEKELIFRPSYNTTHAGRRSCSNRGTCVSDPKAMTSACACNTMTRCEKNSVAPTATAIKLGGFDGRIYVNGVYTKDTIAWGSSNGSNGTYSAPVYWKGDRSKFIFSCAAESNVHGKSAGFSGIAPLSSWNQNCDLCSDTRSAADAIWNNISNTFKAKYVMVNDSQSCGDNAGWAYIETKVDCDAATSAKNLDLLDKSAFVLPNDSSYATTRATSPYGCYYRSPTMLPGVKDNTRLTLNLNDGAIKGTTRQPGYQSICLIVGEHVTGDGNFVHYTTTTSGTCSTLGCTPLSVQECSTYFAGSAVSPTSLAANPHGCYQEGAMEYGFLYYNTYRNSATNFSSVRQGLCKCFASCQATVLATPDLHNFAEHVDGKWQPAPNATASGCSKIQTSAGWDGPDCNLCNGGDQAPDDSKLCDGVTPTDCKLQPDLHLEKVCPVACGACIISTTTTTSATTTTITSTTNTSTTRTSTTTTGTNTSTTATRTTTTAIEACNGVYDPPKCNTVVTNQDCKKSNIIGMNARKVCKVRCHTCEGCWSPGYNGSDPCTTTTAPTTTITSTTITTTISTTTTTTTATTTTTVTTTRTTTTTATTTTVFACVELISKPICLNEPRCIFTRFGMCVAKTEVKQFPVYGYALLGVLGFVGMVGPTLGISMHRRRKKRRARKKLIKFMVPDTNNDQSDDLANLLQDDDALVTVTPDQALTMNKAFKKMMQEEEDAKALASSQGFQVPKYWTVKDTTKSSFKLVECDSNIKSKMQQLLRKNNMHPTGSCGNNKVNLSSAIVSKVERIENTELWKLYSTKKSVMLGMSSGSGFGQGGHSPKAVKPSGHEVIDQGCNEVWLFHGTQPDIAQLIAVRGFDERVAALGGLYGAGTYFAENGCKSNQYARATTNAREHTIIYARVLMGDAYHTNSKQNQIRRPPAKPGGNPGETFDSVLASGGTQVHREFIVYDRTQIYPEFIIYYK